jgi:hypothetical protein
MGIKMTRNNMHLMSFFYSLILTLHRSPAAVFSHYYSWKGVRIFRTNYLQNTNEDQWTAT